MPRALVLVVEDDPAIRRGLVDALRYGGYEVRETGNGREALDLALEMPVDRGSPPRPRAREAGAGALAVGPLVPVWAGGRDHGDAPGIGLGLALSRALARDLGGDLTLVESGPAGARFRLELELA